MQIVYEAIDRSLLHDDIVHLTKDHAVRAGVSQEAILEALFVECENMVTNDDVVEFHGVNLDGEDWRVHVHPWESPAD